ncbi:MAG: hypothetical protein JWN89_329 [Parcubacteria group bacterium]|nr:hypothetical protein [Parcubacteria group bacterium]
MVSIILFYFSGAVIVLLLLAKIWETKRRKPLGVLTLISKGDTRLRSLSHIAAHSYGDLKERGEFFVKKQLPLHTRNFLNKSEAVIKEKSQKYLGDIRNTKLLKPKNEGISEFFKNISEMEKETAAGLEDTPENLAIDSQNSEEEVK